ncbi:MAG: PorP/SprF family type IX secretion system membrane protein [Bacteroidales bacterium]|jgi:type IX secretion system PorP/SprF family membrane protein|nr:PorP/SprF family type IX secretion system membrane protein [Bacteroidales bacterium]
MKRFLYISILAFGVVVTSHAQTDPMFFQQTNNRGLINPATTGKGGDMNAAYAIRQQWVGFPGPATQAISGSGFVRQIRSGFGLSWINDKFGPQRTNNIKLNYAYFVPFEEVAFLSFGLGMGIMSNIYDESNLFNYDDNDELITDGKQSKTLPDFDFGFEFNTRYWEVGASVTHITYMYDDQILVRPMRNIYAYTRVKLPMNKYWDFIPGVTWHNTRKLNTCEVNAAFRYNNNICVNLIYRNPVDCGIAFGIDVYGGIRVTYSYDYGFDNLNSYNSGSHEITLSYNIPVNTTYVRSKLRFFRWKMF